MWAELHLKLWFQSNWYFSNNTKSGRFWKALSRKKDLNNSKETLKQMLSCEYCEIFTNNLFHWTQSDKVTIMDIGRSSFLNQKHYVGWFLLKRFVHLFRVSYFHIISRNHSNTLFLFNLQKTKTCTHWSTAAKVISSDIRILTV